MFKLCVLALAVISVASTSPVAPESEVETETELQPDNSNWPWSSFDSWTDADNDTLEYVEREDAPETETFAPSGGQRIKGGQPTNIKNHPYQVSIMLHRFHLRYMCSGSIISYQWVLTAAHCSLGAPSEFVVRSGSRYYKTGGYTHKVSSIYIHYLYSPKTLDYDVGLMKIAGVFQYNDYEQPIALAKSLPKTGTSVTLAGWGITSFNGSAPDRLQAVNLTVTSEEDCKKSFSGYTSRRFCAGFSAGGRGGCEGDSGAPLVSGGEQIGILTSGLCKSRKLPTIFMSIPKFRKWIRFYTGV